MDNRRKLDIWRMRLPATVLQAVVRMYVQRKRYLTQQYLRLGATTHTAESLRTLSVMELGAMVSGHPSKLDVEALLREETSGQYIN